jgi:hypothetical protein
MAQEKDNRLVHEIILLGGMDTDSDQKFIREHDYRLLVNGIKTGDQEDGIITNIKGTENIDVSALDGISSYASLDIIGSVYDYKNEGTIIFINTNADDPSIIRYVEDDTLEKIIADNSNLNFSQYAQSVIIDDMLIWQEIGEPAQMINLPLAEAESINYNSENKLSLIKPCPLLTITTTYGYDSTYHGSNVFRKIFQFREQYIYINGLKSCFGNTSDLAYNDDVFNIEDNVVQKEDTKNFIDIKFTSGDDTVEKIRIAAREGNNRDWFEIVIIDKDNPEKVHDETPGQASVTYETSLNDSTTYYYRFFNTGGYRFVADQEIEKPFEYLPIYSYCMSAFGNNRLVFGQNKMDYAGTTLGDLEMLPAYQKPPPSAEIVPSLKRGRYYQGAIRFLDQFGRGTEPLTNEDTSFYVEDLYDTETTGKTGRVRIKVTGLDTVDVPTWAEYYQFLITAPESPFIQVPVLWADEYRDLDGQTDGTVALLLGFSVDALNDAIQDKIEALQNELDTVNNIKKVYEKTEEQDPSGKKERR